MHEGGLSPEMAALGMKLEKSVDPTIYYIGFNMNDRWSARRPGTAGASCARR